MTAFQRRTQALSIVIEQGWLDYRTFLPKDGDIPKLLFGQVVRAIHSFNGANLYNLTLTCKALKAKNGHYEAVLTKLFNRLQQTYADGDSLIEDRELLSAQTMMGKALQILTHLEVPPLGYFLGTPLMIAIGDGDSLRACSLIRAGVNIEKMAESSKDTALICAAGGGLSVVELLIAVKANVNAKGDHGMTALMVSFMNGGYYAKDIIKILLDAGASVDEKDDDGNTVFDLAKLAPGLAALLPKAAETSEESKAQ
jgi:ankyrin repeat protein